MTRQAEAVFFEAHVEMHAVRPDVDEVDVFEVACHATPCGHLTRPW